MKNMISILMLFAAGCSVYTAPEPGSACPSTVQCAWTEIGTCDADYAAPEPTLESTDDVACWIYDATCVPIGTPEACIPAACHRTIADCQPAGEARVGRP